MSSQLHAAREEIAEALQAAGITAAAYWPERLNPPIALVTPANPYLTSDETPYAALLANLTVTLVTAQSASNEREQDQLDQMIETAVNEITSLAGVGISQVSQPIKLSTNNTLYLAAEISVISEIF